MRTPSTRWQPFGSFLQRQIIQSGAKKRNKVKIDFLIFIKINLIIYQIKHNWMNFMMVKTASKNIISQTFYTSLKTNFKKHVTKSIIFKENAEILFFFLTCKLRDQKYIIKIKTNNTSIQTKTFNTLVSFVVAADFVFLNQSSPWIVTMFSVLLVCQS